eukprot:jgi/Mesvir1/23341/Mv24048-RA.1
MRHCVFCWRFVTRLCDDSYNHGICRKCDAEFTRTLRKFAGFKQSCKDAGVDVSTCCKCLSRYFARRLGDGRVDDFAKFATRVLVLGDAAELSEIVRRYDIADRYFEVVDNIDVLALCRLLGDGQKRAQAADLARACAEKARSRPPRSLLDMCKMQLSTGEVALVRRSFVMP